MGTMIDFPEHDLTAYRADPTGEPRGAVVVIQEIWGLADHIKDVTDRFAAQATSPWRPTCSATSG